jgi:hypothetical protein
MVRFSNQKPSTTGDCGQRKMGFFVKQSLAQLVIGSVIVENIRIFVIRGLFVTNAGLR